MRIIALLALCTLTVLAIACSADEKASTTPTGPAGTAAPITAAPQTEPPAAEPPSNQKEIGNLLLTLNGVQPYSDDIFPAEAGTHYVAVDITGKNIGDKSYSLNVFNFHLKDSDSFTGSPATSAGPDPKIGSHDMVPGQEVRGYIVFKLGDGRNPIELQYQSFTGSTGTIAIPH
jgi:hypothetical protein